MALLDFQVVFLDAISNELFHLVRAHELNQSIIDQSSVLVNFGQMENELVMVWKPGGSWTHDTHWPFPFDAKGLVLCCEVVGDF